MILIHQLIAQNVHDFFLAPGSRSTPLAIALSRHPAVRIHRHFDERGLGFWAAGFGLGRQAPAALVVTSGTAVGNLTPAIMEAHHASIPLIVLTADRPSELREVSANQTTDQGKIFQNFVRWQCEIDPSLPPAAIRSKVAQAVFRSQYPHPGPVHINCPFREPLYNASFFPESVNPIHLEFSPPLHNTPRTLPARGLCLIGRLPNRTDIDAVLDFAKRAGWPVFADILSNARNAYSEALIHHYDWFFGKELPRPECIVHFGERLISKRLMEWLALQPPPSYLHISPHSHWVDPNSFVTERIGADIGSVAKNFSATPDPNWLVSWKALDQLPPIEDIFTETSAMRTLSQLPLHDWAIFLANSMPIREADWFLFPKGCKGFFANRGLSGIDGNIATMSGLSYGLKAPVLGILGDLTTLHDLNSLALLRHSEYPIILLISNNDGGGIFSHLAVATDPQFEKLFGFPHGFTFAHAAQMFQLPYVAVDTEDGLQEAMRKALQAKTSWLIEMKTCRIQNHAHHQRLKQSAG